MWHGGKDLSKEDEPVLLLEPKSKPVTNSKKKNKNCNNSQNPCASFVGGHPNYYSEDENYSILTSRHDDHSLTKCDICHDSMYLLLQMHSPLDGLDRTLYVFACNKASCIQKAFSLSSSSSSNNNANDGNRFSLGGKGVVKCIRSQCCRIDDVGEDSKGKVQEGHNEPNTDEMVKSNGKTEPPWSEADDSGWGESNDGGWGESNDGGWGDVSETEGKKEDSATSSMDELEAMLLAMEANEDEDEDVSQNKVNSNKKKGEKRKNTKNQIAVNDTDFNAPSFKKFELEMYDEPKGSNKDYNDTDNDDDDDAVGITYKDESTVQKMLSLYLKEEDDDDVKAIIQRGSNCASNVTSGSSGNGEKYERLPPEDRAFLAFTDRIRRAPFQAVRYAYNGIPMWSIPTPLVPSGKKGGQSRDIKFPIIPRCQCGSMRKFEFQLMPSLLHLLDVDKYYKDTSKNHKADLGHILSKNEGGMNWGVIAVYSCSNSCNQSMEEYVVLQESIDSNPQKIITNDTNDDDNGMIESVKN